MRAELKSVLREAGTTTIYVTHDQTEAMGLARIVRLTPVEQKEPRAEYAITRLRPPLAIGLPPQLGRSGA
jgi:ABC-type sulfate/molybdate transport systems ATPase subunit